MNSDEKYSCFKDEDFDDWKERAKALKYQERINNKH